MAATSGACNFLPNYRAAKRCDVIDRPCILLNQAEDVEREAITNVAPRLLGTRD